MSRVSVVLCTRNGERFIEEQLRSILDQTMPVDEIVVGDDASTDATLAIIERIAATTIIPVHVARHERALGVAENFADGIRRARGELIALCDQDDVWHPDRIARLVAAIDGVDLVHSDARLVDANGAPTGSTLAGSLEMSSWERDQLIHGDALAVLLRRNLVTGATTLVRREAALAALPVPTGWIHDEWLAMVAALGGGMRYLPEPTVDYRQHGENTIGVRTLSLRGKLARLVEADSGSHARKALRATSLAQAAADRGLANAATRRMLVEKARHERTRANLPDARIRRIPAVARGALAGRYRTFARGALDIARDVLERH